MIATHMTLMLCTQVLAYAASLHDAGIVEGTMLSVIIAPPYKILVGTGESAELWNHEGRLEGTFLGHTREINTLEFSPDNTLVVTYSWDYSAKLWRADSQACVLTFRHEAPVFSAAFSPTGTTILTDSMDHDVKLWSVSSGQCLSQHFAAGSSWSHHNGFHCSRSYGPQRM